MSQVGWVTCKVLHVYWQTGVPYDADQNSEKRHGLNVLSELECAVIWVLTLALVGKVRESKGTTLSAYKLCIYATWRTGLDDMSQSETNDSNRESSSGSEKKIARRKKNRRLFNTSRNTISCYMMQHNLRYFPIPKVMLRVKRKQWIELFSLSSFWNLQGGTQEHQRGTHYSVQLRVRPSQTDISKTDI